MKVDFSCNRATEDEIANHLWLCDSALVPPLSSRVEMSTYAHKIFPCATRFDAWTQESLAGLLAAYYNDTAHCFACITSVSVRPESQGEHLASYLMERCIAWFVGAASCDSAARRERLRALLAEGLGLDAS